MSNFTKENIERFLSTLESKAKERHPQNVVRARHVRTPFGGTEVVVELIDNDGVHDYFLLHQNQFDGNADFIRIVGSM